MSYLDTALLDLVERFARRFQVLTGRTNVWLAVQLTNASIVVYFVWSAVVYAFATLAVQGPHQTAAMGVLMTFIGVRFLMARRTGPPATVVSLDP